MNLKQLTIKEWTIVIGCALCGGFIGGMIGLQVGLWIQHHL